MTLTPEFHKTILKFSQMVDNILCDIDCSLRYNPYEYWTRFRHLTMCGKA